MNSHRRNDILLIVGLMLAALIGGIVFYLTRTDGRKVVIRNDYGIQGIYDLNEPLDMVIENDYGGTNHLHVENGMAWLDEASCPDQICVQQGKIQYVGESIICLPNGLIIEIFGEDELNMDGVSN